MSSYCCIICITQVTHVYASYCTLVSCPFFDSSSDVGLYRYGLKTLGDLKTGQVRARALLPHVHTRYMTIHQYSLQHPCRHPQLLYSIDIGKCTSRSIYLSIHPSIYFIYIYQYIYLCVFSVHLHCIDTLRSCSCSSYTSKRRVLPSIRMWCCIV